MPSRPNPCFKTAEVVWHKASLVFLVLPSALRNWALFIK